jgi:hypothetical protein
MFILTIKGKESEGAYSVLNSDGEHILYIFQEEDDAVRYALMLEDSDHPEMHVFEVDEDVIIQACKSHAYDYVIITPDDIVIPPNSNYDFI